MFQECKNNSYEIGKKYTCHECGFPTMLNSEEQLRYLYEEIPLCDCFPSLYRPQFDYYIICGAKDCLRIRVIEDVPRLVALRVRESRFYQIIKCTRCTKITWYNVSKAKTKSVGENFWHKEYTYKYGICECNKEVRLRNLAKE